MIQNGSTQGEDLKCCARLKSRSTVLAQHWLNHMTRGWHCNSGIVLGFFFFFFFFFDLFFTDLPTPVSCPSELGAESFASHGKPGLCFVYVIFPPPLFLVSYRHREVRRVQQVNKNMLSCKSIKECPVFSSLLPPSLPSLLFNLCLVSLHCFLMFCGCDASLGD